MPTLPLDLNVFRLLNDLAGTSPVFDWVAVLAAKWLIFVLLAGVVVGAIWSVRRLTEQRVQRDQSDSDGLVVAGRSLLVVPLSLLDGWLLSLFLFRERPFASLDGVNLLVDAPLFAKSFPSDHATIAFALAVSILLVNRRWGIPALLIGAVIALGRVVVGVHYPFDVLVGAAFGGTWSFVVFFIGQKYGDRRWLLGKFDRRLPSSDEEVTS